jgi:serpin B
MALGMTRNGAANKTLSDINTALGFSALSDTEINETFKYIYKTFSTLDPNVKVQIANSIWYKNEFEVLADFIATNQEYFGAEVSPLNFASPDAVKAINDWVKLKTNNLIPSILDVIPDEAVMYLVNAVYFKGQWRYKFDINNTHEDPFYKSDGSVASVPFMQQEIAHQYMSTSDFEAVSLPYSQGNYAMTIFLPRENKTIADIIPLLTGSNWNTWQTLFAENKLTLEMPRFKYKYEEKKMKEVLTDLGMGIAFDASLADFTRINQHDNLYISDVRHKTFIETNEEGTEAAAVTSVGIGITSVDPEPIHLTVNRPFVYFISEKSTGSILFIGTVVNPLLD